MRRQREARERLRGVGRLLRGETVVAERVPYVLVVWREYYERPSGEREWGLFDYNGSVSGLTEAQLWDLQDVDVVLVLDDQRRLPCQLVDLAGTIRARGALS